VDPIESIQERRGNCLAAVLGGMMLIFLLVFAVIITGGWFLWLLLFLALLSAFILFHYLLWGHGLSTQTAGEREEAEVQDSFQGNGLASNDPRRPRHD
jgi:hypothetical protein